MTAFSVKLCKTHLHKKTKKKKKWKERLFLKQYFSKKGFIIFLQEFVPNKLFNIGFLNFLGKSLEKKL